MWVKREKFEALEKRVRELESRMESNTSRDFFTVYEPRPVDLSSDYGFYQSGQHIEVKAVVQKLMDLAGIKLVYRGGTPSGVDIKNVDDGAPSGF